MADTDLYADDKSKTYSPVPYDFKASDYLDTVGMTPTSDLNKQIQESYSKREEAAKGAMEAEQKSINEQIEIANRQAANDKQNVERIRGLGASAPAAPNLQKMPAPPQQQLQSSLQAFQSPAVFLALLGSLATRAPLTAAFKAGAAAMEGYHKGDNEVLQKNVEDWKNSVDQALKNNQVETERYKAAMDKHEGNWRALQAEMMATAAGFKNENMISILRSQGPEKWYEYVNKMEDAHLKAAEASAKLEEMALNRFERAREADLKRQNALDVAKMRSVGISSPQGYDAYIKGIIKYDAPLPGGKYAQQVRQDVFSQAPDYDATMYMRKNASQRLGGTMDTRITVFSNEVDFAADLALEASNKFPRGKFVPLNQIKILVARGTSNEQYNDFLAKNITLAKAYGRAMNPQGLPRVTENLEVKAEGLLSQAISTGAYRTQIMAMKQEIANMKKAVAKTTQEISSGHLDVNNQAAVGASINSNFSSLNNKKEVSPSGVNMPIPSSPSDTLETIRNKLPEGWTVEPVQ